MSTIFIKDTGYITPGQENGTQETMVNVGAEIPLKVERIDYTRGANVDKKTQPGTYTDSNLNFVSVDNPTFVIQGIINKKGDLTFSNNTLNQISGISQFTDKDGSYNSREYELLELLDRLCITKGYKELYYKASANEGSLLNAFGKTDAHNLTYRHVHIRCIGFFCTENSKNITTWRLTCEVEKAP